MQRRVHRAERRFITLSEGLGWFSLGLGLTQVLAPGAVNRLIGARDHERRRRVMRMLGVREIGAGLGILTQGRAGWLWARVLGDVVDLALLGKIAANPGTRRARTLAAGAGVLGVTLLDAGEAVRRTRETPRNRVQELSAFITIGCSPEEAYRFWRSFENLPRFMSHLEAVRAQNGFQRWWARSPTGMELKWDAEITVDRPGELIAWRSLRSSALPNHGAVLKLAFEPTGSHLAGPLKRLVERISEQMLRSHARPD